MKKFIAVFIFIFSITFYHANAQTINYYDKPYAIDKNQTLQSYSDDEPYDKTEILDNVHSVKWVYALKTDNTLWKFVPDSISPDVPVQIMENVKDVDGVSPTLVLKTDGTLWGWGKNYYGELVNTETEYYNEPVKIMNNVEKVAAGDVHSIVLKTDGSVLTFGNDDYGQSGHDNIKPTKVLDNIIDIYAGLSSSFAIDSNHTLWHWGTHYGEGSCIEEDAIITTPEKYIENVKMVNSQWGFNLVLKCDNTLWVYGDTEESEQGYTILWKGPGAHIYDLPVKLMDNVNSISSNWGTQGGYHDVLILDNNGILYKFDVSMKDKRTHKAKFDIRKIDYNIKLQDFQTNTENKNFTDISSKSDETQKAINALSRAKIIDGISETEFAPDKTLSRAETAALLLRMAAIAEESGNGGFADVTNNDWYYSVAGLSKKYGIVNGFEDNTFRGDEDISKIQLISLAARTLASERDYVYTVNENLSVPEWAREDISLAVTTGLVDKKENFDGNITRGEAAVILYRLYGLI